MFEMNSCSPKTQCEGFKFYFQLNLEVSPFKIETIAT